MELKDGDAGPAILDFEIFDVLFSDRSGTEENRAIQELVDGWCREYDGCAAALYSPGGDHRLAIVGDADFPECTADAPDGSAFRRLDLPGGGVLLHTSDRAIGEAHPSDNALLGAAAAIIGMKRKLREQNLQAMSQGVELVALYEVGLAIASILDIQELADEVLSRALMLTDCSLGALYTLDDDWYQLACARGTAQERIAASELDLAALRKSGGKPDIAVMAESATVLAVSVEADGQPRGLLAVGHGTSDGDRAFTPKDRSTLSLFANQAAIALEQARLHETSLEKERLDRETELAAEIQQEILPDEMPSIPGFEILGWNRPCRHVGGDYFGFHPLGEDRWALVLGDVSGKGAPAALLVSTLDSALRVLLDHMGVSPKMVDRLNRHVFESSAAHKFITMIAAELEPREGVLTYLNAGHNPGLWLRSDGTVEHLEPGGSPVGMLPDGEFESERLRLGAGDLLCLYSDGITEAAAPDEEEFEIERLTAVIEQHRDRPLDEILEAVDRSVTEFAEGQPQGDDQTVVLLRRSTVD
jgi:sigma-B regulation protein RsbU (phosphoserine phosphatase)